MMPQDFPPSGFEQMAGLGGIQAYDMRTARALDGVERELRELMGAIDKQFQPEGLAVELFVAAAVKA